MLYDDSCGFCRTIARRLGKWLLRRGFALAPLQAPWVAERIHASGEEIAGDIRLLLAGGTMIRGANVYRFALRECAWTYPLYVLSMVPPAREVFDFCYAFIARHRHRVSRFCSLPGAAPDPASDVSV